MVLDAGGLNDSQMQQIAVRLGCSHTAYVNELSDGSAVDIRFFTPTREIPGCGHGTIAAHVTRALMAHSHGTFRVRQITRSGVQEVHVVHDQGAVVVSLKQPEIIFTDVTGATIQKLLSVLGLSETSLANQLPICLASVRANRFLVGVDSLTTLESLKPDFRALRDLCTEIDSIGCFVFVINGASEAAGRMFAPVIGVNEDTINGNSSGCLGAYLLRCHQLSELTMTVYQGQFVGRPGRVHVRAEKLQDHTETIIAGTAAIESSVEIKLNHL